MRREIKCLRRMGKKGEEGRWGAKCKIDQTKSPLVDPRDEWS